MTDNLYSNKKWAIKWLNDEKKSDEKMLFYVQNYSFIFSHAASFFISFMIIDLRFRHIIFEQRIFLIIVFDKQREFLIFHSISKQAYELDKLIDEHMSYSSLDSEKISLLRALCLIFFFWNSKRFTTRKKKRFHWH
jgi:hypothetical protein